MPVYLLCDVGSTYTKGCLVDTDKEEILATASDLTSADTDINLGIEALKAKMQDVLNTVTIDEMLVCSSAKGGLKMIAVGLVPDLTLKAATLACYSAGAKVIGSYAYELNRKELDEIESSDCDILLLCGGTDGGNTDTALFNAQALTSLNRRFPIIYAGNKVIQDDIHKIFIASGFECSICPNVMPSYGILQVEPCREVIRDLFLKTIIKAKGLSELSSLIDDIVLPTPSSVLEALTLLSKGTRNEAGLGDLMAIDIGGATTDVYSLNAKFPLADGVGYRGLREPLDKRSVEGDLGVRFNAHNVYELKKEEIGDTLGMETYLGLIESDIHVEPYPRLDSVLASWCTEIACKRHAGRLESAYSPMGVTYSQTGKDLREVSVIIGIGGPLIHSHHPESILRNALSSKEHPEILLPRKLEPYLDSRYIVSCLGLLAKRHPDTVVRLLKKNLEKLDDAQ